MSVGVLVPLYLVLLHSASGINGDSAMTQATTLAAAAVEATVLAPSINAEGSPNTTVALGKTALLTCRIRGMTNRTVAWIRHSDLNLLTVGTGTYTSDARFSAASTLLTPEVGADELLTDWSLQIQSVRASDEGVYECQVGTTPHINRFIHLTVVEPTTTILGGTEIHINIGSTINLTCLVKHSPDPPAHVFWTHNQQTVNYDSARGGISVLTEKGALTLSSLLIQNAQPKDSGSYVCAPSSAPAAATNIHVLAGEQPAAMYSTARRFHTPGILLTIWLWILHGRIV